MNATIYEVLDLVVVPLCGAIGYILWAKIQKTESDLEATAHRIEAELEKQIQRVDRDNEKANKILFSKLDSLEKSQTEILIQITKLSTRLDTEKISRSQLSQYRPDSNQ